MQRTHLMSWAQRRVGTAVGLRLSATVLSDIKQNKLTT